ncbi:MAG: M14 family metallopeptidase [Candidatus Aminicenantes bacterium]|nr:M14 family metallopeptidase [Candidatus Aminicenantes bacterium]
MISRSVHPAVLAVVRVCLVLAVPIAAAHEVGAQELRVGFLRASPGQTVSGLIEVAHPGGGTSIPVTLICGAKPGKVLGLVAGVHGYEYPPILALVRIRATIDPARLSGSLILVHIANLPAFQKRLIYYGPSDWKNLNRVFPGDARGSLSERIARVLTDEVIGRCDALIDLHCGDGNEALIPYSYWMISGDPKLDAASKELALAFGIEHIIIDETRSKDPARSLYFGNTAVLRGKPAVTTESGYLGRTDEEDIVRNVRGILSVMKLYKIMEGTPDMVQNPVWIDKYEVVSSGRSGMFRPLVERGYYVRAGQRVGLLTDYFGNVLEEVRAPFTGIVLYIIGTPPANQGEPLFEVGRVKEE